MGYYLDEGTRNALFLVTFDECEEILAQGFENDADMG